MLSMKNVIPLLIILISFSASAVEDSTFVNREKKLSVLLDSLRSANDDLQKEEKNAEFKTYLNETLQLEGAFSYPFSKLKTVGFIDSPDGQLRIINWNIELDDQTQKYYCFLMHLDEKKKNVELSELIDNSDPFNPRPTEILEANQWYGALYYKIIPVDKGSKTVYTVLGWDGNTGSSNIKLIDVLYFTGNTPKLGSPIFKNSEGTFKRMFYEHSEKATMSLKYEEQYKRIIFDHLMPESPNLKGFYSFYVPDLSLDAFVLSGNKWIFKEDVIGINKENKEETDVYVLNSKTNTVEKKGVKNKWENPEDNGPAGGIPHVAVTPEDDLQNPEAQKEKLDTKAKKKDKRDPSNMSSVTGGMKKKKRRKS
ncbi:MAG: hypothetical protein RLZ33_1563 [Bacteroidota bacterium]